MKKLKQIESSKMNFDEQHRLSHEEMGHVKGGAGCICYHRPLIVNDYCVCDRNPFGLCSGVSGGMPGEPGVPGVPGDQG